MPASDERDETGDVPVGADAVIPAPDSTPRFRVRPVVRPSVRDDDSRVESVDETGEGWGDAPDRRGDDWYRRERPPHHGS